MIYITFLFDPERYSDEIMREILMLLSVWNIKIILFGQ